MSPILARFKIAGLLLAPILLVGGGYYWGQLKPAVIKTEYKEHTVYQDRVVVRSEQREEQVHQTKTVKKPDGTLITTETVKQSKMEADEQAEVKTVDHSVQAVQTEINPRVNNYSLGLNFKPSLDYKSVDNYELYGAKRVLGDVWVQGTVSGKGEFMVGLRIDF